VEEFSRHDLAELQVELSHARREIRHLQQKQTQLLAELQQAHEIFEQIHRHPVAGPVVRIRQKVLEWLARLKSQQQHKPQLASSPLPANRTDPHSSPLSRN
jgi:vacuolar-type H+-ATPase subunit D/Vma8